MEKFTATAVAHPNIAFIKYWGIKDHEITIPANGSISMNLAGLESKTTVEFLAEQQSDQLTLNGKNITEIGLERVSKILDFVRLAGKINFAAKVISENNFPTGSGIASSASGFAALALASSVAAGLNLETNSLSSLARLSSGSASRSIPGGFVEWIQGEDHKSSYSKSIAPPDHWKLADCIAIVNQKHKPIGSLAGHQLANTSPLQTARIQDTERRLDICRQAILNKDFIALAEIMEIDSNIMHGVMMSSSPSLFYWDPPTLEIMRSVAEWRNNGLPVAYTIDAGPNVHVICNQENMKTVSDQLKEIPGVINVLSATPGGPAKIIN